MENVKSVFEFSSRGLHALLILFVLNSSFGFISRTDSLPHHFVILKLWRQIIVAVTIISVTEQMLTNSCNSYLIFSGYIKGPYWTFILYGVDKNFTTVTVSKIHICLGIIIFEQSIFVIRERLLLSLYIILSISSHVFFFYNFF